jgi:flavin-dependent dehydrogenase
VGIGAFKPGPGVLQATLRRVMDRYDIALDGARLHGHPLPIYTGRQQITTRRVLLVGDAAGLVDPLTGEGIRYAVQSGRMAANVLAAGRPETYQERVRHQIGRSHAAGLALAWLFYHVPRACYELGVRNPLATHAFVDLLSGRTTYPRLIARLVATLPLFLATEAVAGLAALIGRPEWQQRTRTAIYNSKQTAG